MKNALILVFSLFIVESAFAGNALTIRNEEQQTVNPIATSTAALAGIAGCVTGATFSIMFPKWIIDNYSGEYSTACQLLFASVVTPPILCSLGALIAPKNSIAKYVLGGAAIGSCPGSFLHATIIGSFGYRKIFYKLLQSYSTI